MQGGYTELQEKPDKACGSFVLPISEIQSPLAPLWPEWHEVEAQNTSGDRHPMPTGVTGGRGRRELEVIYSEAQEN